MLEPENHKEDDIFCAIKEQFHSVTEYLLK